jgi:RNA polymerase sigma-70 factor (ECF subfamily)
MKEKTALFRFSEMPDENLMDFIRGGNLAAFDALVARHQRRFYTMVYRWVMHKQDAEDIVQDAFLKLWSGKARWKSDRKARFVTWFYRILYNQAMDALRSRKRATAELVDDIPAGDLSAEDEEAAQQEQKILRDALCLLPENQRVAVNLFYFEDMSQKQIAAMMGISVKALESLLSRAKAGLRERIVQYA